MCNNFVAGYPYASNCTCSQWYGTANQLELEILNPVQCSPEADVSQSQLQDCTRVWNVIWGGPRAETG